MFNRQKRTLKRLEKTVKKIEALEPKMQAMTDEELQNQTIIFKERLKNGETLDDILPEAFAVVREASFRTIGLKHFPVQLMGGIVLHEGNIAEMKTGEGKTLVATCPAYLNALTGKPVHIVTVNDYLANRDAEQMGQVHRFLGLTVGVVLNPMSASERKAAYNCDITYVTNNELGFDYLRDNMARTADAQVLRGLGYCIIDEVDSVLIDEARTPLIISGVSGKSTSLYVAADTLAKQLEKGELKQELSKFDTMAGEQVEESGDFIVDLKTKQCYLTEAGTEKAEKFFHVENLSDPQNIDLMHHINLAIKANYLMHRDIDYVVKENQVLIVDEFTGRTMPGRRYSDGLHQAIEAKEHVEIKKESRTFATITFQNFFNKFEKKAGMTGTAKTEEKEFINIYHMPVIEIPTNRPVIRKDLDDIVYKTKKEKYNAIIEDIEDCYKRGQPVLVGTITIETSELLSRMLRTHGIPHTVLNAKHIEEEAEIIANAGCYHSVTIATNMAGRGTDIKLDEKAKEAGGLKVIGTERHEARRIDNQLRGRSGRQGDPGTSRFYVSMEDDLIKLFGSDRMKNMLDKMGVEEGEKIEDRMLSKAIGNAQKKVEDNHFGTREQLLKYDEINNIQREYIYSDRNHILRQEMEPDFAADIISSVVETIAEDILKKNKHSEKDEKEVKEEIMKQLSIYVPIEADVSELPSKQADLVSYLKGQAVKCYENIKTEFEDPEALNRIERDTLLALIDQKWMNHIDDMAKLRETISLQAYGQRDPLTEYKISAFEMFGEMLDSIKKDFVRVICHIKVRHESEDIKEAV